MSAVPPDEGLRALVLRLVCEQGPLTGAELRTALGADMFRLWKACATSPELELRRVGRRYVRLDRAVEGFARLSPSILREFMTYTIVGAAGDDRLAEATRRLSARITVISRNKARLAARIVAEAFDPLVEAGTASPEAFCVLIAGDIIYGMAHDVIRRESSTDQVVEGSDLDIIVLVDDAAAESLIPALDAALLSRKWLYLRNPAFHEEVDYVVKPFSRLVEQTDFATFPHMVACKVYDEARLIYGSPTLHERARALLDERGVLGRLRGLETAATLARAESETYLFSRPDDDLPGPNTVAFYTHEERAEFEH